MVQFWRSMMKFNIIVVSGIDRGKLSRATWDRLNSLAERVVIAGPDKLVAQCKDAEALLVGFEMIINTEVLAAAPKLRYIGVLGTAFDRVDSSAAKQRGIVVTNLPGYSTEAVAEWVFGVLLEHLRDLSRAKQGATQSNYSPAGFSGSEIKGKVFGVIGLGRIGARVAEIALGFGADVRYWSRTRKKDMEARGVTYEELAELVRQADFLSLHVAGTKDTENLLNRELTMNVKRDAIIVNTVSMKTIDVGALEERLQRGEITFIRMHSRSLTQEQWNRLRTFPNMIVYPAITNVTKEANQAREELFVRNIEQFLRGEPVNTVL